MTLYTHARTYIQVNYKNWKRILKSLDQNTNNFLLQFKNPDYFLNTKLNPTIEYINFNYTLDSRKKPCFSTYSKYTSKTPVKLLRRKENRSNSTNFFFERDKMSTRLECS